MILHQFNMSDVEDPYLYAAFPISEWQESEKGKWIMNNTEGELIFHISPAMDTLGYKVTITGNLKPESTTYYMLKYQ